MSNDAVFRYRAASETGDMPGLLATLAPNVELISPLSGRMVFRGKDDVGALLAVVYGGLSGWQWHDPIGADTTQVLVGAGRVGPFGLGDAMVVEVSGDGLIRRLRPHLRPWLGTTFFALVLVPKLRPAIILRALRRATG
jgi:hypothetical protein